jgi:hypothetical protein
MALRQPVTPPGDVRVMLAAAVAMLLLPVLLLAAATGGRSQWLDPRGLLAQCWVMRGHDVLAGAQ